MDQINIKYEEKRKVSPDDAFKKNNKFSIFLASQNPATNPKNTVFFEYPAVSALEFNSE